MNLLAVQEETIKLVKEVGAFIRKEAENFSYDKVEHKGFNDLVSYVDKTAEEKLVKGLSAILPEAGFITEEGTSSKKGEVYSWIIDPLDGTTNFVHGIPVYAVSVALQRNDEIVAGVVYEINRDECFHAVEGEKAYLNDKEISVSSAENVASSLIATGFPYNKFDKMDSYMSLLQHFMKNSHGLRRMGSAAVDLAYVACGRFEAFFEYDLNAWDVAAGAFIVRQAGGKVSDFKAGNNYIFGGEILATNALVYDEVYAQVKVKWN